MVGSATPVPVCTRPAAPGPPPHEGSLALPLSPTRGHPPATTGHAHPGTAATKPTI